MPRVALLDVNVLVALFDADHVHHDAAHDWFSSVRGHGWATTPITENGAVRVLSNPAYHSAMTGAAARRHLQQFCGMEDHTFWPDAVSLLDASVLSAHAALTHRQITDVYLLALAVHHDGCLATFDTSIPISVVAGATSRHLLTLGA